MVWRDHNIKANIFLIYLNLMSRNSVVTIGGVLIPTSWLQTMHILLFAKKTICQILKPRTIS